MKKIIIVGAGIAGLTAGIYAVQSGFDVTIYESHTIPGGASTSWRRKGYLFEGGMHWLTGSSKKTSLNKVWYEVGALNDNIPIHYKDPFFTLEYEGQTVCLYRDVDKLQEHFLSIAPEDKDEILKLCRDVKKFTKIDMPISDIKGVKVKQKSTMPLSKLVGMIPAFPRMSFYANQSVKDYTERFKNPALKLLLNSIVGPTYSATSMVFTMATLAAKDGGYPEGGSLAMASRMAKRFEGLGGTIQYGKPVSQVTVKHGIADGVIVEGEQILADGVIITQDTLRAIDTLFQEPIREPWALKMRECITPVLNCFISLGVETDLSELPESFGFIEKDPILCGDISVSSIDINNYATYKGYAPEGCTALTSILMGDTYEFWKQCKENGTYEMEKQKLADKFIQVMEKKYPIVKGKIVVCDVATPLTYERYLGSYKGSWMSEMHKGDKMESYPTKPDSIKNVYFAGQRVSPPGGLPIAVETGRKAVQYVCRDMDVIFQGNI